MALPVAPFAAEDFAQPFYFLLVALLAIALGLTYAIMRSKVGLALSAVRADEDRARGIGVPVTAVKVLAFAVSVGLTAMVGAVWAYYETFIYPQFAIDPLITIAIVLMTFLGGRATLWGPVVGAFILQGGQQYLAYTVGGAQFYLIAYALVFLATILLLRRGIVATINDQLRLRRRRAASAQASTVPTVTGVAPEVDLAEGVRR
jgi:branched-chain amino acid transport system permease protein